jgi:hypothetical protein
MTAEILARCPLCGVPISHGEHDMPQDRLNKVLMHLSATVGNGGHGRTPAQAYDIMEGFRKAAAKGTYSRI